MRSSNRNLSPLPDDLAFLAAVGKLDVTQHFSGTGVTANMVAGELGIGGANRSGNGAVKGSWSGHMSGSLRAAPRLGSLKKRGLIGTFYDERSRNRYYLTRRGRALLEGGKVNRNTLEGYEPENAEKIPDDEDPGVGFGAGDEVTVIDDEDLDIPFQGESGIVQAVCRVHGRVVVDVLIEGVSEPERFEYEYLEGA